MLFLDTETTGVNPAKDEILSIAIIDDTGTVLLNSYVRPTIATHWPAPPPELMNPFF